MTISFFSPICPDKNNYSFLSKATQFFNFGQKSYKLEVIDGKCVCQEVENRPSWKGIIIRVILCFTLIIPLLAILGMALYRLQNKLTVKPGVGFDDLEPNLKKLIFENVSFDLAAFAETSKENRAIIKNNPLLQASILLKEAYRAGQSLLEKNEPCAEIFIAYIDAIRSYSSPEIIEKEVNNALNSITNLTFSQRMRLASFDPKACEKAKEEMTVYASEGLVNAQNNNDWHKYIDSLLEVSQGVVSYNRGLALHGIQCVLDEFNRSSFTPDAIRKIALIDLEKALHYVKSLPERHQISLLSEIAKWLDKENHERALEITESTLELVKQSPHANEFVFDLIKIIYMFNRDRGLKEAHKISDVQFRNTILNRLNELENQNPEGFFLEPKIIARIFSSDPIKGLKFFKTQSLGFVLHGIPYSQRDMVNELIKIDPEKVFLLLDDIYIFEVKLEVSAKLADIFSKTYPEKAMTAFKWVEKSRIEHDDLYYTIMHALQYIAMAKAFVKCYTSYPQAC